MSETTSPRRTITNRFGLPSSLYAALVNDPYVGGGDISVTRLIAPPRVVALRKKHESEIVEDASDRIWSLLGQSAHLVAERAAAGLKQVKAETRLFMPFDGLMKPDGQRWRWQLSGQPDVYEEGVISDYKVTSVWSFMFGDKPEWDQQLNLQAMLHRFKGDAVEQVQIIAILRDWQKRKAKFEKDYPPINVHVLSFPVWSFKDQQDFALEKIMLHQTVQKNFKLSSFDPESLPLCTPDERWYRGAGFAVKRYHVKTGNVNKKADRLFGTEAEATQYMLDNSRAIPKNTAYAPIEKRPGENIRCIDYCDVAMFCPFGRKLKEEEARKFIDATASSESEEAVE